MIFIPWNLPILSVQLNYGGVLILTCGYIFIDLREREKHQCGRERLISCLPYAPLLGTEPITSVCALTRNRTHNLLVFRKTLQPTEPPGQGQWCFTYLQSYAITTISFQNVVPPAKETSEPLAPTPTPTPSPRHPRTCSLSLWFDLFWTFHTSR